MGLTGIDPQNLKFILCTTSMAGQASATSCDGCVDDDGAPSPIMLHSYLAHAHGNGDLRCKMAVVVALVKDSALRYLSLSGVLGVCGFGGKLSGPVTALTPAAI